jgi:hypothetical protein
MPTVAITAPTDCASINTAGLMDALRKTDRAWQMTRDPDARSPTPPGWVLDNTGRSTARDDTPGSGGPRQRDRASANCRNVWFTGL